MPPPLTARLAVSQADSGLEMRELSSTVEERIGQLNRVTVSIKAARAPECDIDGLLETGFGELIALEAKLRLITAHRSGSLSPSAAAGHRGSNATETLRLTEALRQALSQLQAASGGVRPQRVGCGFVLPRERDQSDPASSPSRSTDPRSTR